MKKTIITALLLSASIAVSPLFAQSVEPPTMGWSSWNTFAVNISEDIIKGQADAMVSKVSNQSKGIVIRDGEKVLVK